MIKNRRNQYTEENISDDSIVSLFKKENLNKLLEVEKGVMSMYNSNKTLTGKPLSEDDVKYKNEYIRFINDMKKVLS